MRSGIVTAFIIVYLIGITMAAECQDHKSRVTDLMNFNHDSEFPCMYSGIVEIDAQTESNMFYWYFKSPKPQKEKKLVLWFSGGPGGSGQGSILDENGPIKFKVNDDKSVEVYSDIQNSFVDVADVIYVDQPLGVGYSNSQVNVTEGKQIGGAILKFMLEFYELYPDQKSIQLIVAGNSYGGHYIPNVVKAFLDHNSQADAAMKIPIESMIAEDGYVDPLTQRLSIKELAVGSGMVTLDLLKEYEILEQHCEEAFYLTPATAFADCKGMNTLMSDTNGNWDLMDVRYHAGDSFLPGAVVNKYFSYSTVQKQLHVIENESTVPFSSFNMTAYYNMYTDGIKDYTQDYQDIVSSGVKVLIYTGSLDGLDGVLGTERWLENMSIVSKNDNKSTKNVFYYKDSKDESKIGGAFKVYKDNNKNTLSYATVYNAGHVLGHTQILVSKALLADVIAHGEPTCHNPDGSCETESTVCKQLYNCHGNGSCVNDRCQCKSGIFGADCSIIPHELTSDSIELFPREWRYFTIPKLSKDSIISFDVNDSNEVYVYHKFGDSPSRSDHNGFKKSDKMKYVIEAGNEFAIVAVHNPNKALNITVEIGTSSVMKTRSILSSF